MPTAGIEPATPSRRGLWPTRSPAGRRRRRSTRFEICEPGLECFLTEPSITTELYMRYPARPSLSPYPVFRHTESLGDLVDGQQSRHIDQADEQAVPAFEFGRGAYFLPSRGPKAASTMSSSQALRA